MPKSRSRLAAKRSSRRSAGPSGVQSIETGVRVLGALAELGPAPMLKTIAARSGMPPAKAHRYLVSFARTGLVDRDPFSRRYRLGPMAREIGFAALHGLDVVRIAAPMMAGVRDELDETVGLVVWGSHGPTFVWLEEVASRPVAVTIREGAVMPMIASATGRVFGAWMPRALVGPLVERELAESLRAGTATKVASAAEAEALFEEARRRGIGRTLGEVHPGIYGLSAPIFDHRGTLAAALSAIGPAGGFDAAWNGRVAERLRAAAGRISHALGFVADRDPR